MHFSLIPGNPKYVWILSKNQNFLFMSYNVAALTFILTAPWTQLNMVKKNTKYT